MKIYLDGIEVQYPNDTLLYPKFSIRRSNQFDGATTSFTGELTFTGSDYDTIYNKLVIGPDAINQSVELKFIDDCCDDKVYIFVIKPESLEWCDKSCEIKANALEFSSDAKAYICVENTIIWDDHNHFEALQHPRIPYCLEFRPSILQDLALILGIATMSMVLALIPIYFAVVIIIAAINAIVLDLNNTFGTNFNLIGGDPANFADVLNMQWVKDEIVDKISAFIVGCNYNHPSPFVRSYIENVCSKCGIVFSSSILNNPSNDYWNLTYFSAQIRKGQSAGDFFGGITNYIDRNKPGLSGKLFLDQMTEPFNAKWDIHNNVLRFERHDFFSQQVPWFFATTYDPEKVISQCYTWTKNPRPSFGHIGYSKDAMDWVGNEAIERWSDDFINWNVPYSSTQKGVLKKEFNFGAARFRGDNLDRDVFNDYAWAPFGIGLAIKANNNVLLMNNGTAFLPKLLILEDGYDLEHAIITHPNGPHFNYPMWVDPNDTNNLYDRFWSIEDPRLTTFAGYDFIVKLIWDCTTLNSVNIDGTIMTSKGVGKVETVDLDFSTSTMTIKGTV